MIGLVFLTEGGVGCGEFLQIQILWDVTGCRQ
jgi:hypothetical protein